MHFPQAEFKIVALVDAAWGTFMSLKTSVGRTGDLADVEEEIGSLLRKIGSAADTTTGRIAAFEARVASDWGRYLFKEQWSGLGIAPGLAVADQSRVLAWGLADWPSLRGTAEFDEAFQVSVPSLLTLQRGGAVSPEGNPDAVVNPINVRRYVAERRGGLLGRQSGQWRCLVEFDPEADTAAALEIDGDRRGAFHKLIRNMLARLEVGALGRRQASQDIGARRTLLEFLYELHTNGWEYASAERGVRFLRVAKHLYSTREELIDKAGSFQELAHFISRQSAFGTVNLVEVSVSDYGPGILDGFLATDAAPRHRNKARADLLDELLHTKISSKITDPNAGLGIFNALKAARAMYAFVSLRTGEFWLTMDGSADDGRVRMRRRPGSFPPVVGTHWQLVYPDMTPASNLG